MMSEETRFILWQEHVVLEAPFVVVAFFTRNYIDKAQRLAASLMRFGLAFAIFETPHVHRSISPRSGSDDLSFTKPRFIAERLRDLGKPVLYVDADCEFVERPDLVPSLCAKGIEFAIYNWFADTVNDAWVPDTSMPQPADHARYWRFSHCVAEYANDQLNCSGCTQFWYPGDSATSLLDQWQCTIAQFPGAADDGSLSYAFNIGLRGKTIPRVAWLPKAYARYAFWLYVQPVINHRDLPAPFEATTSLDRPCFDRSRLRQDVTKAHPFPRACILDVDKRRILIREPAGLLPVSAITAPLFL